MKKSLLVSAVLLTLASSSFAATDGFRPLKDSNKLNSISNFVKGAGFKAGDIHITVNNVFYKNKSEETLYKVHIVKDVIHTDAIDNYSKIASLCDVVSITEEKANGFKKIDSWEAGSCN